jgi:phosphoribosylformimino-5-aminoimidazole carboxamide ribotide isomerase
MILFPALDILNGQTVRLSQGRFDAVTTYDDDPLIRLKTYERDNAEWVHVVDLLGARARRPVQTDLIKTICAQSSLKVQAGGGVRALSHVETLLGLGVHSVVIGSLAAQEPETVLGWLKALGPEKLTIAMDVKAETDGFEVCVGAWETSSGIKLKSLLEHYPKGSIKNLLITDISKDGMLTGPNLTLMTEVMALRPDIDWLASGGVATISDLKALKAINVHGVIIGKALYENRFTLREAINACAPHYTLP